ncbi:MAG: CoA transferase [Alphaproteobacteria bacterium]|nr:CoA transferase [Alphaproteobacteria bacterium]
MNRPTGPFSGLAIVDLTRVLAGPFCTLMLAELGARVIKVEPPEGDDARAFGPFVGGQSSYFVSLNRGKESIALDLKAADDRRIFDALLARADALVENFRPGVMDKLGYGWPSLQARFPRLIYAAISGFGQTGPLRQRAAYDMVAQAMSGVMSLTGHPGGPPVRAGVPIGDLGAGLFMALGLSSALYHRERTGQASMIDVAMLDGQIALLENAVVRYAATGTVPGPLGARHPTIAPFSAFAAADGYIVIAAGNDDLFRRLSSAIGRPELTKDARFASNALRVDHVDALTVEIERSLANRTVDAWFSAIDAAGVPCSRVNDIAQALAEPQVKARNMAVSLDDPTAHGLVLAGNPIKLSAFADSTTRPPAPGLDQNRAAILREFGLGHDRSVLNHRVQDRS